MIQVIRGNNLYKVIKIGNNPKYDFCDGRGWNVIDVSDYDTKQFNDIPNNERWKVLKAEPIEMGLSREKINKLISQGIPVVE